MEGQVSRDVSKLFFKKQKSINKIKIKKTTKISQARAFLVRG